MLIFFGAGGSLTKIAYYSTVSHRKALYHNEENKACEPVLSGNTDGASLSNEVEDSPALSDCNSTSSLNNYKIHKTARLHFIKFETKYIESCLDFVRGHLTGSKEVMRGKSIKATGGGAYKYADLIQEKLGLT